MAGGERTERHVDDEQHEPDGYEAGPAGALQAELVDEAVGGDQAEDAARQRGAGVDAQDAAEALAAGYAPRYAETSLDDDAMARVRASLQRMLDAHDPYPGVVIDRQWDVVLANAASLALVDGIPDHLLGPPLNVFRVCLHPDGLAARTRNLPEWAGYLLHQIDRTVRLTGDRRLTEIAEEVRAYPNVAALAAPPADTDPPLLVPMVLDVDGTDVAMFTTLTTFGTPRDVTLDELAVELFFPADDAADAHLRSTPD